MLIAILISATLSASHPDTIPHCLTLKELEKSGALSRINDLSILLPLGPNYTVATHEEPETNKRTIGFNWSVDSVSFSHYDEIERAALAFSDMINLYFLREKELKHLDEIMLVVNQQGDSTKYHFFNFLIEPKLRYRNYTIDKRIKMLKDLSICRIEDISFPDENRQLKYILHLTISVPDVVVSIEKNLLPLKEALKIVVENFILARHRENYSRYQLTFVGQHNGTKDYAFPIGVSKNETL